MADILVSAMVIVIAFVAGVLIGHKVFEIFHKNARIEDDHEAMGIGTLYIYEGSDRDRYSFAFDCPLDQIGQLKKVTLDIKKRREKSLEELEHDLFAEDFDSNMDNI